MTFEKLKEVVESNEKKRFALSHISQVPSEEELQSGQQAASTTTGASLSAQPTSESTTDSNEASGDAASTPVASNPPPVPADAPPSEFLIRANQGHSIQIDSLHLLKPLEADSPEIPEHVCHGTFIRFFPKILESGGLALMGRTHIHFFEEKALTGQKKAVSGMRGDAELVIFVDVKKAMSKGLKFWISENGVILSEGDDKGFMATEFWGRVTDRRSGEVIWDKDAGLLKELKDLGEGRAVIGKERLAKKKPRGPRKDLVVGGVPVSEKEEV